MQILVRAANAPATLALSVDPSDTAAQVACRYAEITGKKYTSEDMRVVHCGATLENHTTLLQAHVQPQALLEVLPRLRGGGGDGGSTGAESRSAYLAMYAGKKHDKVNPEEERLARWTACRLSGMPLQPPCVCDELGSLFNKDAVIQALMEKTMPKSLPHISSLKHVIDLKLEPTRGAGADDAVKFTCPVTGMPMSGMAKFVVIHSRASGTTTTAGGSSSPSGVVVSERALKEVPAVVKEIVGGEWTASDILPLNPVGEELEALKDRITAQREAERAEKKARKSAKAAANGGSHKRHATEAANEAVNGDKVKVVDASIPPVAKKSRAAELMPAGATAEVWNSLFTKEKKPISGKGNNDYMVRGVSKYI